MESQQVDKEGQKNNKNKSKKEKKSETKSKKAAKTSRSKAIAFQNTEALGSLQIQKKYVYDVYDKISTGFSVSRAYMWPIVKDFLSSLEDQSLVLDIGCGNGKYFSFNTQSLDSPHLHFIGLDICRPLLALSSESHRSVDHILSSALPLPITSDALDGCLCLALVHHFPTSQQREAVIREAVRVCRKNQKAKILVSLWAKLSADSDNQILVPFDLGNVEAGKKEAQKEGGLKGETAHEDHLNRENYRYYYLYDEKEVEELVHKLRELEEVESVSYLLDDHNNYFITITKR